MLDGVHGGGVALAMQVFVAVAAILSTLRPFTPEDLRRGRPTSVAVVAIAALSGGSA